MLCEACQDIFSTPRWLSCGTYYSWKQNPGSFQAALQAGCHLCNLIEESRSYDDTQKGGAFPEDIRYAFKVLNPKWTRSGKGQKWLIPQTNAEDEAVENSRYLSEFQTDPTPNKLGWHLATDSDILIDEMKNSWLVMEFFGPGAQVMLPMELATKDEIEELAQKSMDEQISTGCKQNLEIGKAWLQNCLSNHSSCKPLQPEHWLPTRLLDVGTADDPAIRLVLSSSLDVETQYAALSHRWGAKKFRVLNSANAVAFQEVIPLACISETIRDSVAVTRTLGLRYLWVDSMCIIQDDLDDWNRESATMSKVYGLATCTVAAANSGSGPDGCFAKRNQYRIRPCHVPNPFNIDSKYSFYIRSQYLHKIHDRDVRGSLWYNRGWVFQERTLSPRLLIFSGTQILWACEQLQAAETWPCGKSSENYIDQFESFAVEKARFHALLDPSQGVPTDHSAWWNFIQDYVKSAELTNRSDRLRAIQGIATLIQGLTGEKYCAGFWLNDDLANSLLWKLDSNIVPRPHEYRAPSWSWAAIEGTMEPNTADSKISKKLIDILGHEDLQGNQLLGGRNTQEALRVVGMLLPAAIITSREGSRCDRVLTVECSKTVAARTHLTLQRIRNSFLEFVIPISAFLWKYGLKHISIVVGALLCIVVIPTAIALAIALIPVAAALFLVGAVLWLLGLAFWYIGKLCWPCLKDFYSFCSFCMNRRAEEKENARRAQTRVDAEARRAYILEGMERGIPMTELQRAKPGGNNTEEGKSEVVTAIAVKCSLDAVLPREKIIQIAFLPVIRRKLEISGLLLCLVDGTANHYERLGVFSALEQDLKKLNCPSTTRTILLV